MRNNKQVWTPNGLQTAPLNSMVGKGESIINYNTGNASLVTKGIKGRDTEGSSVQDNDNNVIAGNDKDYIGYLHGKTPGLMSFADQVAPITARVQMLNSLIKDNKHPELSSLSKITKQVNTNEVDKIRKPLMNQMKEITDRQAYQHDINDKYEYMANLNNKYNYGKNKYADGKDSWMLGLGRLIPSVIESGELLNWVKNKPKGSNVYASNPYSAAALQKLSQLKYSPYNELRASQNAERRAAYALNQSGGLTGSQKYLGKVASGIAGMKEDADIYRNAQLQNDKYSQNWAEAALQAGEQQAQRRQAANQYDYETYARAQGARTKGIETHLAGLSALAQKSIADKIKKDQFDDIMGLYNRQLTAQDKENLRNSMHDNNSTTNTKNYSLNQNQQNNKPNYLYSPIVNNTLPQNQYWDWQNNKPNSLYSYKCGKNPKRRMK